jgi:hypothetical protein
MGVIDILCHQKSFRILVKDTISALILIIEKRTYLINIYSYFIKKVIVVYRDRAHAGDILAGLLKPYQREKLVLLVIPNGGVPVGFSIFKKLSKENPNIEFELIIVRKIPIPYNTEAGFGAITIDGTNWDE